MGSCADVVELERRAHVEVCKYPADHAPYQLERKSTPKTFAEDIRKLSLFSSMADRVQFRTGTLSEE